MTSEEFTAWALMAGATKKGKGYAYMLVFELVPLEYKLAGYTARAGVKKSAASPPPFLHLYHFQVSSSRNWLFKYWTWRRWRLRECVLFYPSMLAIPRIADRMTYDEAMAWVTEKMQT